MNPSASASDWFLTKTGKGDFEGCGTWKEHHLRFLKLLVKYFISKEKGAEGVDDASIVLLNTLPPPPNLSFICSFTFFNGQVGQVEATIALLHLLWMVVIF